ncbi:taurine ABC transporter permease TauC [Azospirillum soli]|uniref:taurine ABC transporter permease TauC n=1 Tax=Azospirillum soli TaxID=1304799 RepID=UPI001AE9146F|nr:taurine ABC transporter permease TauC [Azospirillum soli]MBP2316361.1 taurine transport system permease protein [Azospirillum soli]
MSEIEALLYGLASPDGGREAPHRSCPLSPTARAALLTVALMLGGWWAASHFGLVPPLFLPSPEAVAGQAVRVWTEGFVDSTLAEHLGASLGRVFAALLFAILTAVPAGLALGLSPLARGVLEPVIEFYRPIPPLAYLPLIVIWFGIGEGSKVLLIYLAIFAPIAIATAAGVRSVDAERVNAARSLGATRFQVVGLVVLPSALPDILTGVRIGLGAGWSTLVAAELVAATRGLGFMVQSAAQFLVTDVVVLGILVIAAVAFALELLVRLFQRIFVPWQGRQ